MSTEIPALVDFVAEALMRGFRFAVTVSEEHEREFGHVSNLMSRIHNIRSVAQSELTKDDSGLLEMCTDDLQFGKIQVKDTSTNYLYLLRSRSRRPPSTHVESHLFDPGDCTRNIIEYRFIDDILCLSVAPVSVVKATGRQPSRLALRGPVVEAGKWPLTLTDHPAEFEVSDRFDDLDLIDLDADEAEGRL